MIDKILDRYYFKKLKEEIKFIFIEHNLDYKVEKKEYEIIIKVKRKKYKESEYKIVFRDSYDRCLFFLTNIDKLREELRKVIEYYFNYN